MDSFPRTYLALEMLALAYNVMFSDTTYSLKKTCAWKNLQLLISMLYIVRERE